MSKQKFLTAMLLYAVLAVLVGVQLTDKLRLAMWVLLVGLAFKTWIAYKRLQDEGRD